MKINTKLNIGDTAYMIESHRIVKKTVREIIVRVRGRKEGFSAVHIYYKLDSNNTADYKENVVFGSKDDLIKDLEEKGE